MHQALIGVKQLYVMGFLFSLDGTRVALIEKNRPSWMAGKLNGIGGKVDPGEDFYNAMRREFLEETGVEIEEEFWHQYVTMVSCNGTWAVVCFRAFNDKVFDVKTNEDEVVKHTAVSRIRELSLMHNLPWLIPMALCSSVFPGGIVYDTE